MQLEVHECIIPTVSVRKRKRSHYLVRGEQRTKHMNDKKKKLEEEKLEKVVEEIEEVEEEKIQKKDRGSDSLKNIFDQMDRLFSALEGEERRKMISQIEEKISQLKDELEKIKETAALKEKFEGEKVEMVEKVDVVEDGNKVEDKVNEMEKDEKVGEEENVGDEDMVEEVEIVEEEKMEEKVQFFWKRQRKRKPSAITRSPYTDPRPKKKKKQATPTPLPEATPTPTLPPSIDIKRRWSEASEAALKLFLDDRSKDNVMFDLKMCNVDKT